MAKCFPKPLKPKLFDSGSGLRAWSVGVSVSIIGSACVKCMKHCRSDTSMTGAKKMVIADEAHKTLQTQHRPKIKLLAV